jgi:competence protein ComEA
MLAAATGFLDRHRTQITIALVALLLAGTGAWLQRALERRPLVVDSSRSANVGVPGAVKVQVSGAVANPGVYDLTAGDRVEQAVASAGGPTADADLAAVNLAAKVKDEMRVVVPTARAPVKALSAPARTGLVDLNTASSAELESLPGIGPVTAGRILGHRATNGPFGSVDDLLAARLLSATTLERIRPMVEVR